MIDKHKLSVFKELFNQAESVLIIYAPDALRDHLFAATALYKTFQQLGNKDVSMLSSESLSSTEQDIVYLDETKSEIGHKNLCITLDYDVESVEKITSSIDEESKKLYITIKPKKGVSPLSQKSVQFSNTGAQADMVILVGVDDLESLDQLYIGYENLYQNTSLVSINSYETSFGNLKMDILESSCVSEYVAGLLRSLNYQLDHEVATNLLSGIDEETDKLESYLATADTFELVSYLLRAGARRFARKDQSESSSVFENGENNETIEQTQSSTENNIYSNNNLQQDVQNDDSDDVLVVEELENVAPKLDKTSTNIVNSNKNTTQPYRETNQLHQPKLKKRGRGRPKGSKNKPKSKNSYNIESNKNTDKYKPNPKPKPGDLGYEPSGLGPSAS